MKAKITRLMILAILLLFGFVFLGCEDDNDDTVVFVSEDGPPPVPQGVYSTTGDGLVLIEWLPIDDVNGDFEVYVVYRSDSDPDTGYWAIGETTDEYFFDDDVVNGYTYFYAVSSVDVDGNLSDLSYEYVYDTPRPEGINRIIFDFYTSPDFAGWDLANEEVVHWADQDCDFYLEYLPGDGVFYFNVGDDTTDIQDMGYTENIDEISYSPDSGWSQNGWCEVINGHTYIIWTADNHFAKIRVKAIGYDYITFDWAYQVDNGNRELKPVVPRSSEYLRRIPAQFPAVRVPGDET